MANPDERGRPRPQGDVIAMAALLEQHREGMREDPFVPGPRLFKRSRRMSLQPRAPTLRDGHAAGCGRPVEAAHPGRGGG